MKYKNKTLKHLCQQYINLYHPQNIININHNNAQFNSKDAANYSIIGCFLGDVAGSIYEGRTSMKNINPAKVNLFTDLNNFTDDSVLTIAIYQAMLLIKKKKANYKKACKIIEKSMRTICKLYPDAGYGFHFAQWALNDMDDDEYKSWGNGSAMRAGVIGAMFDNVEDVIKYAVLSAYPTHGHEYGIKGAVVTAVMVYLATKGYCKDDIIKYGASFYSKSSNKIEFIQPVDAYLSIAEIVSPSIETIVGYDTLNVKCETALPLAIINFRESKSYEECLRNCLNYPSDTDTVMAISGSFAGVYYALRNNGEIIQGQKEILNKYNFSELYDKIYN